MGNAQVKSAASPAKRSIQFSDLTDGGSGGGGGGGGGAPSYVTSTTPDTAPSTPTPSLHERMLRERKNREPYLFYEPVQVLGEGSMGSVCLVRKRAEAIGGSARSPHSSLRDSRGGSYECNIPILGGLFRSCVGGGKPSKNDKLCIISNHAILSDFDDASATNSSSRPLTQVFEGQDSSTSSKVTISRIVKRTGRYQVFYALKSIHLDAVADETLTNELRNEVELLKGIDHPHIVKAIETFEYKELLFMVMELCSGGDLYSRDPYTEEEAARITWSILSAVSYLHSKNIIHRDLKYENIMFANSSPRAEVKIIDFGLSRKYASEELLHEGVGTIYTMAPQVLQGVYDSQADLWSIGVIAFMLLSGMMPFYGKDRPRVINKIMKCDYRIKGKRWKKISPQAKCFVEDLLEFDPEERPNAEEALQYIWLNKRLAASVRNPGEEVLDRIQATLETYAGYSKLKKLALMVVAHKSTSEEVGILRKVYKKYDTGGDGRISLPEFRQALSAFGYTDEKAIEKMFKGADLDGSGVISYTEFLAATIESHGFIDEERLAEAFDQIDDDDSGFITSKNLRALLGNEVSQLEIDRIIAEADLLHDNRISYEEFLALWNEEEESRRESTLQQVKHRRSSMVSSMRSGSEGSESVEVDEELTCDSEDLTEATGDSLHFGFKHFSENKHLSMRKMEEKMKVLQPAQ